MLTTATVTSTIELELQSFSIGNRRDTKIAIEIIWFRCSQSVFVLYFAL